MQVLNIPYVLIAFGFGNLAMLGWLATAAAPLLIHMWSRNRFRETPWAAMQFLLAAVRKNARRVQLQQWLLLAIRTSIVVLVVLAVAEPYGGLSSGSVSVPTHKVVVIDSSMSMAYQIDGVSRFSAAKDLATNLVKSSRTGDRFTVIQMASRPKTVIRQTASEPDLVIQQIESVMQTHTAADLPATIRLIDEALDRGASEKDAAERSEVYFLSDLQRASWQDRDAPDVATNEVSVTGDSFRDRLAAMAKKAAVTIIDLSPVATANLAVTRVAPVDPFLLRDREIGFDVTVRRFGESASRNCAVELLVDGEEVSEQTVAVPANGEATARLSQRFATAGWHVVHVRTAHDALDADDSRWLVVPVRDEVRVLCVAGREGAARYVANALNPEPESPSGIRPVTIAEGDLADVPLGDFDCIFLCNVAQLSVSEAIRLARYVDNGGGVVCFLGDRVIPERYNAMAMTRTAAGEDAKTSLGLRDGLSTDQVARSSTLLLPARVGKLISNSQFGLDPLGYRHPIVAPFRGRARAGLLTTPVARYFQLDVSQAPDNVEIVAATRSGDPFLVAAPLGRGRTVLAATDASLSSIDPATGEPWTSWPTWPSFLPIIREIVAYVEGRKEHEWQQLVGTTLRSEVSGPRSASSGSALSQVRMVQPDGRDAPAAFQTAGGSQLWTFDETYVGGIYSLKGLPSESRPLAVNVDTTESDLSPLDRQQLPPEVYVLSAVQNSTTINKHAVAPASWIGKLLWSVLALMLLEATLAWQFGRRAL